MLNGQTIGAIAGAVTGVFVAVFRAGKIFGEFRESQGTLVKSQGNLVKKVEDIARDLGEVKTQTAGLEASFKLFQREHENFCRNANRVKEDIHSIDVRVTVLENKVEGREGSHE